MSTIVTSLMSFTLQLSDDFGISNTFGWSSMSPSSGIKYAILVISQDIVNHKKKRITKSLKEQNCKLEWNRESLCIVYMWIVLMIVFEDISAKLLKDQIFIAS